MAAPIEHPPPTVATVKLLYAHAFACAYPNCGQPLYREDELSGAWALNSRICHICARSEGGPRWDPNQSADENRSTSNLVLMCLEHASAIDDPKALAVYPTDRLREWKQKQINDYMQRRAGWPLTRAMADQAIGASFANVEIAISNSNVQLGGEGGRAPGAGGGGGGAIGRGSRGGRGGDGGRYTNLDGDSLEPPAIEELPSEAEHLDPPPGAGGGGAPAMGPGAIGGDGGHGGDGVLGALLVEAGDVFEIEVGAAGEPARLPGQHGIGGGDTILRVKTAEGVLKRVIRAAGGRAAKSGELPDDWAAITTADLEGGFAVSTLLAANSLELRDGMIFMLSGGWSSYVVPELPFDAVWPVICVATWEQLSAATRGLQVCLSDPDGVEVSRLALELPTEAVPGGSFTWMRLLGAPLRKEGRWRVSAQSGSYLLSQVHIDVSVLAKTAA